MSRTHSSLSISILQHAVEKNETSLQDLYEAFGKQFPKKSIYDCVFRLTSQELIANTVTKTEQWITITSEGKKFLNQVKPVKDGVWKLIIFDIPEKQRFVRNHLRSRLKALGFKKWQSSTWISPYAIDPDIEAELNSLANKFFIRLIKSTQINHTEDLEKMFED